MATREQLILCIFTASLLWSTVVCSTLYFEPNHSGRLQDFPFRNTSLPWNDRVNDLVSRLTLEEIQLQMARGGSGEYGGPAPAIPRLGNFFFYT